MRHFYITIILIIASGFLFYILWLNGYMILSRKSAVLFVGLRKKGRYSIKFASCSGWVKKVIKIYESRNYTFKFKCNISKGNVTAEIRDKSKNMLLRLDKNNPESTINLQKNSRYYLVLKFENADGDLELTWN